MLQDARRQVAGDADVQGACMAAEDIDVATGHSKMLAAPVLSGPEKPARQMQTSLVERAVTPPKKLLVREESPRCFAQSL
jgi:hypothetical protein